jgi:DNA repair exonuclease SbcCD ATPase subunit
VLDELIADNYVEKIGRKHKATTKLQNLISEAHARPDQPESGSSDDDGGIGKYTTILQMMEFNTSHVEDMEIDDRPIPVQRKRRSSVGRSTLAKGKSTNDTIQVSDDGRTDRPAIIPTSTPRKSRKRVRFSDPGPAVTSSGLTPAISRYSIQPEVQIRASNSSSARKQSKTPKRRRSLPARLSVAPASDIDPPNPVSGEVRFVSLRQVLAPRVQRVLWRNNLSEEVNEIEAEKRAAAKQQKSIERRLKERLAAKDKELGELQEEIEITRQLAIDVAPTLSQETCKDQTVRVLEEEIARLREEIETHREQTVDSNIGEMGGYDDGDDDDFMVVTQDDFDNDVTSNPPANPSQRHSPLTSGGNLSTITPEYEMAEAEAQTDLPDKEKEKLLEQVEDLKANLEHLNRLLERDGEDRRRLLSKLRRFIPADSQQPNRSSVDAALDIVLTRLALEEARSGDAQQALHALSSEVSLLGFEGEGVEDMLNTIHHQFRQARLELEYINPGENIDGFENSKLLGMLVERVRALMKKVKDREEEIKGQVQKELTLRNELEGVSGRLKDAEKKIGELEIDADEKDRSLGKLQQALDGYRDEVRGLETLISHLDDEHQTAIAKLQGEMDEAVHDLEGRMSEETVRRQGVEGDVERKRMLIVELEARIVAAMGHLEEANTELRITKMEKDTEIRRLENAYRGLHEKSHDDVKTRDERIAELQYQIETAQGRLTDAQTSIADLAAGKSSLEARLAEEVKRGIHTLETLQAGMRITMAEKEEVVQKLEGRIRELDSRYLDDVSGRDRQITELREQIGELQTIVSEAQGSISNLSASNASLETRLAQEVESGIRAAEATQAKMRVRVKEKEELIRKLEFEKKELSNQYRSDLDNRDSLILEMRHQVETLRATLADAQTSIANLTASKTALEARLANERKEGNSFAEDMQAEAMRWMARMGDMTNTYRRRHKLGNLQLPEGGTGSDGDNRQRAGSSPLTPNSMVRFAQEPLQKGTGRRKYDSGIGVCEEEYEEV